MEVMEDFESRPLKAVSFLVESEKELLGRNEQKLAEGAAWFSGGRLPGKEHERKRREEGGQDEDSEERKIGMKSLKKCRHQGEGEARMRMARRLHKEQLGKGVKQNLDCSQIENEEEEEEEDRRKENQWTVQWAEDEKWEEIFERRRMEGSSLQVEVIHKVPGLVVHDRMSQGKEWKCTKEMKKVKGWCTEEMKDHADRLLE